MVGGADKDLPCQSDPITHCVCVCLCLWDRILKAVRSEESGMQNAQAEA